MTLFSGIEITWCVAHGQQATLWIEEADAPGCSFGVYTCDPRLAEVVIGDSV